MIVSTDAEKAYNKIQHPFMIKTLSMLDTKGTFLNAVKALYTNPQASSYGMGKSWEHFHKDLEPDRKALCHHFYSISFEVLTRTIGEENSKQYR